MALTGWGKDSDRQKSRKAGLDRNFVKPVEPEALRELLASPGLAPSPDAS